MRPRRRPAVLIHPATIGRGHAGRPVGM